MSCKNTKNQKGFGIVEIVIGVSLISVTLFSIFEVSNFALKRSRENENSLKASFLVEEGLEALKVLRDSSWNDNIEPLIADPDKCYFEFDTDTSAWRATTTDIYVDGVFERKFVLSDVCRDINTGDIADCGVSDPNTIKVTVSVSWLAKTGTTTATTTRSISTYLHNLFEE